MNQIEEDITTDQELTEQVKPESQKKSELMRPEYHFKGSTLFPYTYGYELLFNQVRDREDTGLFTWLAFIFLLSQKNGESSVQHRKWAIDIAWRIGSFRESLVEWMDETGPFTDQDKMEAKRIYDEIQKLALESTAEPVSSRGEGSQKKMRLKKNT